MLETDNDGPTSEVLATRALGGNQRALSELLARHKHEAYRIALRMAGSPEDAEEILQNSLERVVRHLKRFDPARAFRPWLLKIVTNQARTYLRKRTVASLWFAQPHQVDEAPATEGSPEETAARAMMRRQLERALLELPPGQREVFILKHIEGLSFAEVSEVTGSSVNSLKVKAHRARQHLLKILSDRGVTLRAACG